MTKIEIKMHVTFSIMVCEFWEWQAPCWKLPQVPEGVPKLANLMAEMDCPEAHCRWTLGVWRSSAWFFESICQFSMLVWNSKTSAQIVDTDLFPREILVGSPPISSKTTNKFLVGFNQDLGTWYLQIYIAICIYIWAKSSPTKLSFFVLVYQILVNSYQRWVGCPQPVWHLGAR